MKFDDINLLDDKLAPKLDLDFGLDTGAADDGKKSSGFSFGGGWGGGWGGAAETKATSSWGFGGADTAAAVVEEVPAVAETSSWGFGALGGSKKKKGAAGKSGFDFDFQDTPEGDASAGAGADLVSPAVEEAPVVEDSWGGFAAAGYVNGDA